MPVSSAPRRENGPLGSARRKPMGAVLRRLASLQRHVQCCLLTRLDVRVQLLVRFGRIKDVFDVALDVHVPTTHGQAFDKNAFIRVSTRTVIPGEMCSGTWMISPVERVAAFSFRHDFLSKSSSYWRVREAYVDL